MAKAGSWWRAVARVGLVAAVLCAGVLGLVVQSVFGAALPLNEGSRHGVAITAVEGGYVACYALPTVVPVSEGSDVLRRGAVVVDTCTDGTALDAALAELKVGPEDVVAVLLTHGHSDHTGGLARFAQAAIYAHDDELPYLRGEAGYTGPLTRFSAPKAADRTDITPVSHGERLVLGSRTAVALHVPGHTPGSVVWWVDGVLFFGDSAGSEAGPKLVPAQRLFSEDAARNQASLATLRRRLQTMGLPVEWLLFGHTGALRPVDW